MTKTIRTQDIFSGEDLRIANLIQRRRLQILVHSYIYYELDDNVVADDVWYKWSKELENLQTTYPDISDKTPYLDGFEDWDGTSGAFLPYHTDRVRKVASLLLGRQISPVKKLPKKQKTGGVKRLF